MERITIEKFKDLDGYLHNTATACVEADKLIEQRHKACQVKAAAQVFAEVFEALEAPVDAKTLDALRKFLQTPEGREAVRDLSRVLW